MLFPMKFNENKIDSITKQFLNNSQLDMNEKKKSADKLKNGIYYFVAVKIGQQVALSETAITWRSTKWQMFRNAKYVQL